jgi:hypothetical protein
MSWSSKRPSTRKVVYEFSSLSSEPGIEGLWLGLGLGLAWRDLFVGGENGSAEELVEMVAMVKDRCVPVRYRYKSTDTYKYTYTHYEH